MNSSSYTDFIKNNKSLTAEYLKEDYILKIIKKEIDLKYGVKVKAASANNLKNIDLDLPLNGIVTFSGVSGSGKTSLLFDVLAASAHAKKAVNCQHISGLEKFESVIKMDQTPIGKNPLSTPITFLGLYDDIRTLFAASESAVRNHFKKSHFSYNTTGGRCETCKGQGQIKISMDFLSDVWITCTDCHGKRFNTDILNVKWNNYSIADILNVNIHEAQEIFKEKIKLRESFQLLDSLGLGHLKLGQSATTLSGGEAQRIKLAKQLLNKPKSRCLYILDEPTTGLHFYDIEKLLNILFQLRDQGHALYIIEHHPWLLQVADLIVELGPEGGENGGYLMN